MLVVVFERALLNTLVVHRGLGGLEDSGSGEAHVQLRQRQLVHEVRQLERDKNVADLGKIKIKTLTI